MSHVHGRWVQNIQTTCCAILLKFDCPCYLHDLLRTYVALPLLLFAFMVCVVAFGGNGQFYAALFGSVSKFLLSDMTLNVNVISNLTDSSWLLKPGISRVLNPGRVQSAFACFG